MFVEARAKVDPSIGATWIEVAGAYAMFDGASSPITQTFGLGLFEPVTDVEIQVIESFFQERGAPTIHEVSPLAGVPLLTLLSQRGYQPVELTSVMFRPLSLALTTVTQRNEKIRVRIVETDEHETWAKTATRGWSESNEFAESMTDLMKVFAGRSNGISFLAELEGIPVATGALNTHEGVALMAGASTVPEGRNQGAQNALLQIRLQHAAQDGCDIAMMCAEPGSASQRNAERHGFRIAYTRTKWQLL
ncbi:MAG: GNAT family N-acetyltransferase [Acidobacteriota bacterium]